MVMRSQSYQDTRQATAGFTLVELLVVISIIGILAGLVTANVNSARAKARDAQRQSDLSSLQTAIELYVNGNGRSPGPAEGGLIVKSDNNDQWIGQLGTGLVPLYIARLPIDPVNKGAYVYTYATGKDRQLGAYYIQTQLENPQPVTIALPPDTLTDAKAFIKGSFQKEGVSYFRTSGGPASL